MQNLQTPKEILSYLDTKRAYNTSLITLIIPMSKNY